MFKKQIKNAFDAVKTDIKADIKSDIETMCRGLVYELFANKEDEEKKYWGYGHYRRVRTLGGEIKDRIISAVSSELERMCEEKVEAFISGEGFIDSVVERIRKKQLTR